jgi:putative transposase
MRSFVIRLALRINKLLGRKRGHVWGDRFHARELTSPREVRRALVYLMSNHLKHGAHDVGLIDPFSSAFWLDGMSRLDPVLHPRSLPEPTRESITWLLLTAPLHPLQSRDRSLGVPRATGAPGPV